MEFLDPLEADSLKKVDTILWDNLYHKKIDDPTQTSRSNLVLFTHEFYESNFSFPSNNYQSSSTSGRGQFSFKRGGGQDK